MSTSDIVVAELLQLRNSTTRPDDQEAGQSIKKIALCQSSVSGAWHHGARHRIHIRLGYLTPKTSVLADQRQTAMVMNVKSHILFSQNGSKLGLHS